MGQVYLASGKSVSMRLWEEHPGDPAEATAREYETVGYVIKGRAELESEGQRMMLGPGDSWVVPKGAVHRYRISEAFLASAKRSLQWRRRVRHLRCMVGTNPRPPQDADRASAAR
jgi:glyoxylate utilization-related uncharacterized protein